MQDYDAFLATKSPTAQATGIVVPAEAIHPSLFPFQRALVQWCVQRGRAALWAATGLGKTRIALEWARLLDQRTLMLAPLAVAQQTVREGTAIDVGVTYVRSQTEADAAPTALVITNYEMLHEFDTDAYGAVVLDESGILKSYSGKTKQADHERLQDAMRQATQQYYQQSALARAYTTAPILTHEGPDWTLYEGDCVRALAAVPDNTVGFTITSPPFANLYIYSDALADMGNSADMDEFCTHLDYLMPELYRVTMPGRLMALHCKDLPLYMNRDGAAGLLDFPAKLRECAERAGWVFHSRITIWKDPVTEMQRTKNHGLLHKNFAARREVCRQGMADYVLVFRAWKDEIPDKQISTAPTPGHFIGENEPSSWRNERDYSIQVWQRYASPVWFDIRQQRVLPYLGASTAEDEKHICPLQLDVIERCIWLWSNEGDICLDCFGGIGSTAVVALQQDRRAILCELKASYVQTAIKNITHAIGEKKQQSLF